MKRLFVMLTIVALLGLPLAVWADPDVPYQYFEPESATAEASVSTESAVEEAVSTSGVESDSAAKADAEEPRELIGDETFIE